ncbi:MAG: hypothetical protein R3C62_06950 [Chloroflexota bacterium]
MQLTIEVPDYLAEQIEQNRDHIAEILEHGFQQTSVAPAAVEDELRGIVTLLASQPTPRQILNIWPSAALQDRLSNLLYQSKTGTISREQIGELERYLLLDHMVRLAKGQALQQL